MATYCLVVTYWDAIVSALIRMTVVTAVIFAAPLVGFGIGVLLARYDLLNRTLAWAKAMTVRRRLRQLLNAEHPALRQAQPLALPATARTTPSAMAEPEMGQLIEAGRDHTLFSQGSDEQ